MTASQQGRSQSCLRASGSTLSLTRCALSPWACSASLVVPMSPETPGDAEPPNVSIYNFDLLSIRLVRSTNQVECLDATFYTQDVVPTDAVLYYYNMIHAERSSILDDLVDKFDRDGRLDGPQLHAKLATVVSLRNIFSYSLQPQHELVNFEELYLVHRDDDAFTASLKYIVRTICARGQLDEQKCRLGRPDGRSDAL